MGRDRRDLGARFERQAFVGAFVRLSMLGRAGLARVERPNSREREPGLSVKGGERTTVDRSPLQ
jgi:hypothetical protein